MTRLTRKAAKDGVKIKVTMDDINKTQDEVIDAFANERFKEGIEGLEELAHWYKSAGCTRETFNDLCTWIVNEATEQADSPLLGERVRLEIRKHRAAKHGGEGRVYAPPLKTPPPDKLIH